jgi:hypothetical protein
MPGTRAGTYISYDERMNGSTLACTPDSGALGLDRVSSMNPVASA